MPGPDQPLPAITRRPIKVLTLPNVRQTEKLAKFGRSKLTPRPRVEKDADTRALERDLTALPCESLLQSLQEAVAKFALFTGHP